MNQTLRNTIKQLKDGIRIEDFLVYAKKEISGRFEQEVNLDIFIKREKCESKLLIAKIFLGRDYYKPWVELFGISPELNFGNLKLQYFDSVVEDKILEIFGKPLISAGSIYVEYEPDKETLYILQQDLTIPISRLGYILFNKGFTWFKDWYFPEGYLEGGRKLQGEKPFNKKIKSDHLKQIKKEVRESLKKLNIYQPNDYIARAIDRAKQIL